MKKTLIACLLALSLLISLPAWRASRAEDGSYTYSIEAEGPAAENLTRHCSLTSDLRSTAYTWRLTDQDLNSSQVLQAGQRMTMSWWESVPVRAIWMAFKDYPTPDAFTVQQFDASGALLKEDAGSWYVNQVVFLEEGTRSVTILPKSEINLSSLYAYGTGAIPSYHPWEPTPEKLDYLIVAMHPDDDVLFMGAVVPLYTVEQGREGTIFYAATRERVRKDEAGNGAWIMGLRKAPILGTFPDIPPSYRQQYQNTFQQKDVVKYLVALFRRYKPEVIFSHDLNGEYGHWQHVIMAHAVQEAVPLAADPSYDKSSAELYGTWQVKKLYLHLYAENPIRLPATKGIAAYGGLTPVEIAAAAFQCHQSQMPSRHAVTNEGVYSMSDFGLAYTAVGLDTPGLNDPFEHIEPAALHGTPTPVPADTPAPTETPAPADTPAGADTPVPAAPSPAATAAAADTALPPVRDTAAPAAPTSLPEPSPAPQEEASPLLWLLPLLIGLAAILCIGISFLSKAWWQRILLWVFALLLSVGAALLLVNGRSETAEATPATAPTAPPVYELAFTTETLPEPSALSAYPELKTLDVTACQQVTASWYEAIRQAVPADCRILWYVPLTDGRFSPDSTTLTLPHFSPEDGALLPYFEKLTAVDASGSVAYDALLALAASRPDLKLTFTLPVGDQVLTMDDESLTVREAPDFSLLARMLPAFPRLRTLDMSEAAVDPADAAALAEACPDLDLRYSVPVGGLRFPMDAESIALDGADLPSADELLAALPYLPRLQKVDLHGTGLSLEDVLTILDARPELTLSHRVTLAGQETELDAEDLDLRSASLSPEELVSLLRPFTALKRVYLPQGPNVAETADLLKAEHPETLFFHQVTAFGKTVENDLEELDVSGTSFASPNAVLKELDQLPCLKKLVMCDCGLSNEQMEELLAARPDVKFVWTIHLAHHALRTDAVGFSTKNPTKHTQSYYSDHVNNWIKRTKRLKAGDLKELKYCTDLVALDLGHNYLTNEDLEVFKYLPHLQILILADNKITDISALAYLKELRYVELFMNNIPDVSPLVGLPNLVDINIANIHLKDITPLLSMTQAERLWFSMNGLTPAQNKAVAAALPNCVCNYTARDETGDGWREHERYFWMRGFFGEEK